MRIPFLLVLLFSSLSWGQPDSRYDRMAQGLQRDRANARRAENQRFQNLLSSCMSHSNEFSHYRNVSITPASNWRSRESNTSAFLFGWITEAGLGIPNDSSYHGIRLTLTDRQGRVHTYPECVATTKGGGHYLSIAHCNGRRLPHGSTSMHCNLRYGANVDQTERGEGGEVDYAGREENTQSGSAVGR